MIPTEIFAADYETPHEFSAGDTLSADMMNELFDYIKLSKTTVSSSDLVGTWSCKKILWDTSSYSSMTAYYTAYDSDNLLYYLNLTLQFLNDGDGTYSWRSSGYSAFTYGSMTKDDCDGDGKMIALAGQLIVKVSNCGSSSKNNKVFNIFKDSNSKIKITETGASNISLMCNKQNLPPTTPATLNASASGKTVSLTWTDSSTDETGFKVLRKDSLTGSYSTITTTSADTTSYSDTVTTAGSYWYRVSATNSNGDSVASKMVKVDVE